MASVTKDGRIILYYKGDTPIYADADNVGYLDRDPDQSRNDGHPNRSGDRENGPTQRPKEDKPKGASGKKNAVYKLVRGADGTLRVQYVDVKTGKPVTQKDLSKYNIVTAQNKTDTPFISSDSKDNKSKKKEEEKSDSGSQDEREEGNKGGRESSSTSSRSSNTSPTSKTGNAEAPNNSVGEQGDTEGFSPNPNANQSVQATVNAEKEKGWTTSPIGQPDTQTTTQNTPNYGPTNYTPEQVQDVAKTLAGEIDTRQTDVNTPEGLAEAAGIVSTMQNRAVDNDISGAIHAPKQYSAWNADNVAQTEQNYKQNPTMWNGLAESILNNPAMRQPYTNYFNPSLVNPGWAKELTDQKQIGAHLFGVDPSQAKAAPQTAQPADLGSMPTGLAAQRDYSPPTLGAQVQNAVDNKAADNALAGWNNRDNIGSTPSFSPDLDSQMAQTFGTPGEEWAGATPTATTDNKAFGFTSPTSDFDNGRFAGPTSTTDSTSGGFASADVSKTSRTPGGFDTGRFGATPGETSDFDSGRFGNTNPSLGDIGRMPGAALSQSPTGVYGSPTGGFGTNVSTDPNAAAASGQVAAANTAQAFSGVPGTSGYNPTGDTSTASDTSSTSDTPGGIGSIGNSPSASTSGSSSSGSGSVGGGSDSTGSDHSTSSDSSSPGGPNSGSVSGGTGSSAGSSAYGGDSGGFSPSTPSASAATSPTGGGFFGGYGGLGVGNSDSDSDTSSDHTGGFSDGFL